MPAMRLRIANGPEAARATDQLRQLVARRDEWPFPWVIPPPNSIRRNPMGYVLMPAVAASATILTFQVPQGFQFDMLGLVVCAVTTGMVGVGNPGDYIFTVNRNLPASGTVPLQGSPLADLQNIPFSLGLDAGGVYPFPLPRSENFGPTDIIRANVYNASGAAGTPNFALAMFTGWLRKA